MLASGGIPRSKGTSTMTKFKNAIRLTLTKTLFAGLVATSIFSAPLQAHENRAADRRAEQSMGAVVPRTEGSQRLAWPYAHLHASAPSDQPGGICDHGDDAMIC